MQGKMYWCLGLWQLKTGKESIVFLLLGMHIH